MERSPGSTDACGYDLQKQFTAGERGEVGDAVREGKLSGFDIYAHGLGP